MATVFGSDSTRREYASLSVESKESSGGKLGVYTGTRFRTGLATRVPSRSVAVMPLSGLPCFSVSWWYRSCSWLQLVFAS